MIAFDEHLRGREGAPVEDVLEEVNHSWAELEIEQVVCSGGD